MSSALQFEIVWTTTGFLFSLKYSTRGRIRHLFIVCLPFLLYFFLSQVHDHFRPSSKLFPDHRKWDFRVFLSTVGCLATLAGLYMLGDAYGHKKISMMYWPA